MNDKIPLLDLHTQFKEIEKDVRSAIERIFLSQNFILGPEVDNLEQEIASYVSCKSGIGTSSGSDAVLAALMALKIGPQDEVITSSYTFFATAGAISRVGAKPVFVDIEPNSFNLNVGKIERLITKQTKAVIPVHLFGQACEMAPLLELCKTKNIPMIEDAAQAIGTEYQGKRIGSFGVIACFSFFPSKNLGAMGDGGMVTTNDESLAEKLRILRSHGSKPKYFHHVIGGNFRLDALQAAILQAKFKYLDAWTLARQRNADIYDQLIQQEELEEFITPPWRRLNDRHIFNQYVIRAKNRDHLKNHLSEQGIQTEIYYPLPMHLQPCFSYLGHQKGDFPEAEKAAQESLAIPIYPELNKNQQEQIVVSIKEFYKQKL